MITSATRYQDGSVRRQLGADVRSNAIQVKGQGFRSPGLTRQEGGISGLPTGLSRYAYRSGLSITLCRWPSSPRARPRGAHPCPGTEPNTFRTRGSGGRIPGSGFRTPRAVLYPPAGCTRSAEWSVRYRFTAPSQFVTFFTKSMCEISQPRSRYSRCIDGTVPLLVLLPIGEQGTAWGYTHPLSEIQSLRGERYELTIACQSQ
jgi:hypothetical protein